MILDHIGVGTGDFEASRSFYLAALKPLGYAIALEGPDTSGAGFGRGGKPEFWIQKGKPVSPHLHIAFSARSRAEVDAFYSAALAAGGRDNGAPGLRPHYHASYYGAFVLDPDGYNIEAVCHAPE